MRTKIALLLLVFSLFAARSQKHVTVTGAGAHDGSNEANAWTLSEANNADTTNETIYVKAGNYGIVQMSSFESGATWEGYKNVVGDIITAYSYPDALDNLDMPTITGTSLSSGTAMTISAANVTLKNFQFTNINFGVNASGANFVADNILCHTLGTQIGSAPYEGLGIRTSGNNPSLTRCYVVNAGAEAIAIQGDSGVFDDCHVYSDLGVGDNGTDYYILISGGDNNIVRNCTVNRYNETNAGRHGLVIKSSGTGNLFEDCVANDVNIEASFVAVQGNTWKNIEVNGSWSFDSDVAARLRIANGAHDNEFINIVFDDVYCAISFADWDDGLVGPGNTTAELGGGNNNVIINPIVKNSEFIFMTDEFQALDSADNNKILSGTFHTNDTFARTRMDNSSNRFVNCIVYNTTNFLDESGAVLNVNTEFENVNVSGSFAASSLNSYVESDITTLTPSFVSTTDFHLTNAALDIGQDVSIIHSEAGYDFDGNVRTMPYTLGAYQFGSGLSNIINQSGNTAIQALMLNN